MTNNIAIGFNALSRATDCKNCVCIGENAGFDITDEDGFIRIGNFAQEEVERGEINDCYILQNGKVVIKKDVLNFLGIKIYNKKH